MNGAYKNLLDSNDPLANPVFCPEDIMEEYREENRDRWEEGLPLLELKDFIKEWRLGEGLMYRATGFVS